MRALTSSGGITINGLTLRQVVVGRTGQKAIAVASDDAFDVAVFVSVLYP